jgi:hypothetical protein
VHISASRAETKLHRRRKAVTQASGRQRVGPLPQGRELVNIGSAPLAVALLKRGNDLSLQALVHSAVLYDLKIALKREVDFGKGRPQGLNV